VVDQRFAPKESAQQRQRVIRQSLVDKFVLAFKRLCRTATWLGIIVKRRVHDLWKQFRHSAKPRRLVLIHAVERLSNDELAGIGCVANVQPLSKRFFAYV
jgi:hypothetical protein